MIHETKEILMNPKHTKRNRHVDHIRERLIANSP